MSRTRPVSKAKLLELRRIPHAIQIKMQCGHAAACLIHLQKRVGGAKHGSIESARTEEAFHESGFAGAKVAREIYDRDGIVLRRTCRCEPRAD